MVITAMQRIKMNDVIWSDWVSRLCGQICPLSKDDIQADILITRRSQPCINW